MKGYWTFYHNVHDQGESFTTGPMHSPEGGHPFPLATVSQDDERTVLGGWGLTAEQARCRADALLDMWERASRTTRAGLVSGL